MYGSSVRLQVFEVIVRQAIAGAPWREICAGPMAVNKITAEDVQAEVDRRLNLFRKEITEKENVLLVSCLDKWKALLKLTGGSPLLDDMKSPSPQIAAAVGEFYSAKGLPPPKDIVICKSPLTLEFYWRCSKLQSSSKLDDCMEVARSLAGDTSPEWLAETLQLAEREFPRHLARSHGSELTVSTAWNLFGGLGQAITGAIDSAIGPGFGQSVIANIRDNLSPMTRPISDAITITVNSFVHEVVEEEPIPRTTATAPGWNPPRRLNLAGIWNANPLIAFDFIRATFEDRIMLTDDAHRQLNAWLELYRVAPWYVFFDNVCYVGCLPVSIVQDERRRISNRDGAAVVFADGCKIWAIDGIGAPRKLIEDPSALTAQEIDCEPNVSLRRLMLNTYGISRFLVDTNASLIQEDEFGQLYRKDMVNDEPLVMVRVVNKTMEADGTYAEYFLRVPPAMTTAKEAVAWSFQIPVEEYEPLEES